MAATRSSEAGYRLVNAGPSPYGRKVAIALIEKGIPFETIFDEPWADALETRAHNPLEQLHILLVEGEEPVFDSTLILRWLEIRHPEPPLLPEASGSKIAALRLQTLAERLMEIAQSLIFENFRAEPSSQAIDRATRKIERGLAAAEELCRAAPLLHSNESIHLGHVALGTTLTVWEFVVEQGMSPRIESLLWRGVHPLLTRTVDLLEQRSSFEATRPSTMAVNIAAEVS